MKYYSTLVLCFCICVSSFSQEKKGKPEVMATIICECLENKSADELDQDFPKVLIDCENAAVLGALISLVPINQDSTITISTDGGSPDISKEDKIASQKLLEENCEIYNAYVVSSSEMDAVFTPILEESCACIGKISSALSIQEKNELIKNCIETSINNSNISEIIDLKDEGVYEGFYEDVSKNLFELCPAVEFVVLSDSQDKLNAYSSNDKAMSLYDKGIKMMQDENYKSASKQFKKAVQIDDKFVYAWDNLGISYRYLGKYDDAIDAYKKSIAIDSLNRTSLMNIAVAYNYKKDFVNSEKWYSAFKEAFPSDPEGHYGLSLSLLNQNKLEPSLHSVIQAYTIYKKQGSPYIADAEKVIRYLAQLFEQNKNTEKFETILKENKITLE